ncbi:MAG: TIGR03960 family B12-binding radical SAM protein, partial [Actinobacteria bacterium]|nr:TIGR03960 family B12-binding radical SAM protein [Actinomycetota bacterium]
SWLDEVLIQVERPARYIGGEVNASRKSWSDAAVHLALAYPDLYEIGASNLGLQILYEIVNARDDALADRVYLPWTDMQERMRACGVPLFSLESRRPVASFDILGITLQHELTYTNIVRLLDLAGIERRAASRADPDIIVVGGGPGAYNPEPVAELFDILVIGDGEEAIGELIDAVAKARAMGLRRRELLEEVASLDGFYVPSFFEPRYEGDALTGVEPLRGAPPRIRKRCVKELDAWTLPSHPIVPFLETVHDRASLEVFRGCTRGCRFCQAGYIYRPVRERSAGVLEPWAERLVDATGYGEVSLSSLSTADYSDIRALVPQLGDRLASRRVTISFPSLRCDSEAVDLAALTRRARRSGLTFAPEAGSQRLRDRINKGVDEADIFGAVRHAHELGWRRIKLYFMSGLPGEREEDVLAIADLAKRLLRDERGKLLLRNQRPDVAVVRGAQ